MKTIFIAGPCLNSAHRSLDDGPCLMMIQHTYKACIMKVFIMLKMQHSRIVLMCTERENPPPTWAERNVIKCGWGTGRSSVSPSPRQYIIAIALKYIKAFVILICLVSRAPLLIGLQFSSLYSVVVVLYNISYFSLESLSPCSWHQRCIKGYVVAAAAWCAFSYLVVRLFANPQEDNTKNVYRRTIKYFKQCCIIWT